MGLGVNWMSEKPRDTSEQAPRQHPLAMAASIGTELVVAVILGLLVGRWADAKLGTQPALLLIGVFAGITVGLYQLIRRTKLPQGGTKKRD
jgi:ATP synthase protein I